MITRVRLGRSRTVVLWNEGENPAGSQKYHAALALVRAMRDGRRSITVGTCGNFGIALAHAVAGTDVRAVVITPVTVPHAVRAQISALGGEVVVSGETYEDAVEFSRKLARQSRDTADGNVTGPWASVLKSSFVKRAIRALSHPLLARPARLWVPTGNGTTLASCFEALRQLGREDVELHAVSSTRNNSITAAFALGNDHRPLDAALLRVSSVNEPLCNWNALDGARALAAIASTRGGVLELTDDELLAGERVLTRLGISATPAGSAGAIGALHCRSDSRLVDVVLVTACHHSSR